MEVNGEVDEEVIACSRSGPKVTSLGLNSGKQKAYRQLHKLISMLYLYLCFNRLVFGSANSPYYALRMHTRGIELAKRAPDDSASAFSWATVELNLPGMEFYGPSKPRVCQLRADGQTAADVMSFYDDVRPFGLNEQIARAATHQIASRIQHLGVQDATRKQSEVTQRPGAGAGSIVYTEQGLVCKFVSQEKWDKLKWHLSWFCDHLEARREMDRQLLALRVGFLLHVVDTYDFVKQYLQGFFISYYAHLEDRDVAGYRRNEKEAMLEDPEFGQDSPEDGVFDWTPHATNVEWADSAADLGGAHGLTELKTTEPPTVQTVPRMHHDLQALCRLFVGNVPIQCITRPVMGAKCVCYGGGDASGEGFGSLLAPSHMPSLFRTSFCCDDISEKSSNYRDFCNLLEMVTAEARLGRLAGHEL
jgi:hypothetical protein